MTLCLAGDVMLGRGIDQVLPHSAPPELYEPYVRNAMDYVALAERSSGSIPRRVAFDYVWGDALQAMARAELRVVNLETAVTARGTPWPGKGIHYRMHPGNLPCLGAACIDCCVLANNHVLDWGYEGLADTLSALHAAGIRTAGAGRDADEARAPAILDSPAGRVLVFAYATESAGVAPDWAAGDGPGVNFLERLSPQTVINDMERARREGDLCVVSLHWGANWGYEVSDAERAFAHALIDGGADVVHGHSSHHPKRVELHRGRAILYGCGDLVNDYEGIGGYEAFRPGLGALYFFAPGKLELEAFRVRRFRLERASAEDARSLAGVLNFPVS